MTSKIIPNGYYIKARNIKESKIAIAPPHIREIWDWILRESNHKDGYVNGRKIARGELIRSFKDIQEDLKWMVGYRKETYKKWHCESAMKWLTREGMITTTKTTRGMLIKVIKYGIYQDPKNYESNNESETKATREQHENSHYKQECKNVKNKQEDNIRAKPDVKEAEVFTEEQLKEKQLNEQIQEVIDLFYNSVNPNINYGNKTTRSACKFLIDKYGVDQVKRATEYAISVQGKPYAPTITTPFQLKEKMSQLAIYKQKQEQPTENHKGKEIFT